MGYTPSKEVLQNFANYIKNGHIGEQITISELRKVLPTKAEARRLLDYLIPANVIERRRGGGYFLAVPKDTAVNILTDLITHGPIIYPNTPDEPVRIYRGLRTYPPVTRISICDCEISVIPSKETIPENDGQIVQGTILITPTTIELDDVNKWIVEKFLTDMGYNFAFSRESVIIPASGFCRLSPSEIAQTAVVPLATLAYLSNRDILDNFRKLAKKLIAYERRINEGLNAHYPEITYEFFWGDYDKSVKPFVRENSDRIRIELRDRLMELWRPEIPVTEVQKVDETEVEVLPNKKKSILNSLLKKLFRH